MARSSSRSGIAVVAVVAVVLAVVGIAGVLATTPDVAPFEQAPAENGSLAPGVYANGTVSVPTLLSAHQTALREQGFVTRTTVTAQANGSVVATSRQHLRATENLSRVLVEQQRTSGDRNVTATVYSNETRSVGKVVLDGNETFQSRERVRSRTVPPISRPILGVFRRAAGNITITDVTETNGERRITLNATLNQTSLGMVVDGQGVVRSLELQVRRPESVIDTTYRLQQLGVDTVDRPSWVSEVPTNLTARPDTGGATAQRPSTDQGVGTP